MTSTPRSVENGLVVTIEYTLWDDEGTLIDSSNGQDPLIILQGYGELLPRLEEALRGMAVGEEVEVVLEAADAYGEHDPEAYTLIPHDEIPPDVDMELGMELYLEDESTGEVFEAYVTEMRPEGVVLDFNHPLAGETLRFQMKVIKLRLATAEELAHGHSHSNNHHHE
ncbi:MAG: peptidylprolyl isomerase [Chloroflexi bacterium]|nr:peptidylprolyl isomerase [Chloroflexota bacterium]